MDNNNQIIKQENISESVLARVNALQDANVLTLPKDYAADNALKAAWLKLQDVEDRAHNKALSVCTKESIANALFDMVLQGLSVSKNQGYFVVYGKQLIFQRSYFGTLALARRCGAIDKVPNAQVIYADDEFVYTITDGNIEIVKHEQKLANIDNNKIVGAYAVVTLTDGTKRTTIMTWSQIMKAWGQGATKGASPAHKNFAEEMAKKTVIGRACKLLINSADDAWLYDGKSDDTDRSVDIAKNARDAEVVESSLSDFDEPDETEYEEVGETQADAAVEPPVASEQPESDDDLPY